MNLRSQRQREFAHVFLNRASGRLFNQDKGGILYLCPRFGKCRVGIHIFEGMDLAPKVLIAYPNVTIEDSWKQEFDLMEYDYGNVTFTTHLSLKKHVEEDWDLVVLDEIHLLSEEQIKVAGKITAPVLGLTGTMTEWTQKTLGRKLGLEVLAEYPIEKAIAEGVITDYHINVVKVPLDDRELIQYKSKRTTEKKQFKALSYVIEKIERENEERATEGKPQRDTKFLRLARMRIIQNSIAKLKATRKILAANKEERILVFCGVTAIADTIGCPVYHSKAAEKKVFEDFANGIGNHLAVVKMGNTGQTYKPLHRVVVNYFDSNAENLAQKINRCMAMEYDTPDKKALITIISTDEPTELKWLNKALEFFDNNKISFGK